jgi:radical SAM protein with 4Fe4S-binding SPASM domain
MSSEHINTRDIIHRQFIEEHRYGKLIGLTTVELNVTELCNRKCVFCPRHDPAVYPNKKLHMDHKIIDRLIEQLKENSYRGSIHISGFGEPLLNPHILDYIVHIKQELSECFVELTTNGDFLTHDKIDKIRNYVDRIVVDCYDSEQQMLERIDSYKNIQFEKYYIRRLWMESKKSIDVTMQEWNFNNRAGAVKNIDFTCKQQQCYIPFYRITIDWNGNIVLCCNDWHRQQTGLGNIMQTSFYDLWFSRQLQEVRKNLTAGKRVNEACKNCSVDGTLYGRASFDTVNQYQNSL